MSFRPRRQNELLNLPDEKIIEYSVAARDAGELGQFRAGVAIFVWRRYSMVEGFVGRKYHSLLGRGIDHPEDRENMVQDVFTSVFQSTHSFRGSSTGELVNWIKTIVHCRVADFISRESKARDHEVSADRSGDGEDGGWIVELADLGDEQGAVATIDLIGSVLALRQPIHRRAIELRMDGYSSIEVSDRLAGQGGISPANVDKVFSRFRKELDRKLRESDG